MNINVSHSSDLIRTSQSEHKFELRTPKSVYVNKFDEASAKEFGQQVEACLGTGQSVVPIVVDSYGGQVYSLMSMIDQIEKLKHQGYTVATIVQGKAMSCGSVLFAAGTRGHRYMGSNATVLIHEVSTGDWAKITDFQVKADEGQRLNKAIFGMLDSYSGNVPGYFDKLIHDNGHADLYLDRNACIKHGLCDKAGIPDWSIRVQANVEFG